MDHDDLATLQDTREAFRLLLSRMNPNDQEYARIVETQIAFEALVSRLDLEAKS